ncbi:MAG: protein TolR [Rickettsiaceae bacterium]|jgi:biopolymer transport protein TolR|nr:protein TolR [Rickettsiaceae bacterium]
MAIKIESSKSGRGRRRRGNVLSEINVTPLVDVMLVLLIIFMITSPMLVAGIQVDLPETSASPIAGQDDPITITIESNGKISIGETYIGRSQLTAKLKAITNEKLDTRVFVRGDAKVSYGKIMEVIGEINAAGFTKVALITEIKNDE